MASFTSYQDAAEEARRIARETGRSVKVQSAPDGWSIDAPPGAQGEPAIPWEPATSSKGKHWPQNPSDPNDPIPF